MFYQPHNLDFSYFYYNQEWLILMIFGNSEGTSSSLSSELLPLSSKSSNSLLIVEWVFHQSRRIVNHCRGSCVLFYFISIVGTSSGNGGILVNSFHSFKYFGCPPFRYTCSPNFSDVSSKFPHQKTAYYYPPGRR